MQTVSDDMNEFPLRRQPPTRRSPGVRGWIALAVVLALAGGGIAWAVIANTGSSSKTPTTVSPILPIGLSAQGLSVLAKAQIGQPIYWAGDKAGFQYELRRTENGNVYIRYLPKAAKVGSPSATFLTVATYPFTGAYQALKKIPGVTPFAIAGGGIALVDAKDPKSVHVAFPNVDFQIEVYDPSPAKVLAVVKSGAITPVS